MFFLPYTVRFANPELLKICALVNEIQALPSVDGAYDEATTEEYPTVAAAF